MSDRVEHILSRAKYLYWLKALHWPHPGQGQHAFLELIDTAMLEQWPIYPPLPV